METAFCSADIVLSRELHGIAEVVRSSTWDNTFSHAGIQFKSSGLRGNLEEGFSIQTGDFDRTPCCILRGKKIRDTEHDGYCL